MKSFILAVFILAVPLRALASEPEVPQVAVFGTAVTQAKPDLLRWSITILNKGSELTAVSAEHASRAEVVLKLLGKKRIRPEEIQTSDMRFSENREHRGGSWVKEGYVATTRVTFTMRSLADYRDLWSELASVGVAVDSVAWDVSNRIEVQNSTRVEALRSARTKAEQMAGALGARIAEPISIEELRRRYSRSR